MAQPMTPGRTVLEAHNGRGGETVCVCVCVCVEQMKQTPAPRGLQTGALTGAEQPVLQAAPPNRGGAASCATFDPWN